eukprot:scaffold89358_cov35-Tisochrysis_lutea.AAC.2
MSMISKSNGAELSRGGGERTPLVIPTWFVKPSSPATTQHMPWRTRRSTYCRGLHSRCMVK